MTELEQRVRASEEYFRETNDEAFETCREYENLQDNVGRTREEWLGVCEVLKIQSGKTCEHSTGLIMLKQRMHDIYRDVRFDSLRTLNLCCALLAETNRAYREYMSLKKQLREAKEEESCVRV